MKNMGDFIEGREPKNDMQITEFTFPTLREFCYH